MKTNERLLAELQPARDALEAWRTIRKHRQPIPAEVWERILPLARAHGANPVARALRLSYHCLRRKLNGGPAGRQDRHPPAFVEVRPGDWPEQAACSVVELEDSRGRRMTLRLARPGEMDAPALVQAFWKGAR